MSGGEGEGGGEGEERVRGKRGGLSYHAAVQFLPQSQRGMA